jgi:polyisoprenoid-binding protein YceI
MKAYPRILHPSRIGLPALLIALLAFAGMPADAQDLAFQLDPQRTKINFILGDVLHTVRGTFQLERGSLRLNSASGKLDGEIVVNAKSGESGNGMRDRKMHREVLESERYPEIIFRPDRVEGTVAPQGNSSLRVHGIFTIHGSDHEITVPVEVEMSSNQWTSSIHFALPYAKWGIKNPSTLFLRVNDSVDIDVTATGAITRP